MLESLGLGKVQPLPDFYGFLDGGNSALVLGV